FSSRRRHTRWPRDWSSDVCSSDLNAAEIRQRHERRDPGRRDAELASIEIQGEQAVEPGKVLHPAVGERAAQEQIVGTRLVTEQRSEERRVGKECRSGWALNH